MHYVKAGKYLDSVTQAEKNGIRKVEANFITEDIRELSEVTTDSFKLHIDRWLMSPRYQEMPAQTLTSCQHCRTQGLLSCLVTAEVHLSCIYRRTKAAEGPMHMAKMGFGSTKRHVHTRQTSMSLL
ncbi:uncharacterized protein LOC121879676 [Homarus americanus]|uniref:uncharacterized protein LOC121879676 n=1 Tax=Homarus americanus TaxID=6706 RepID=UPI001C464BF9|nr:uncharacterized protein LOC121879676 [Homarus americanus]XP_042242442.1 uncharacterized protein LOC121879676 [Homarus americanus]XP_042242519.1 uncharacterized protein LOC121879676 [Homarus americanus]XP_042242581.1 uncharacterized protein LOC121879676 [Homarus americanus]XP_042242652.1 uncharacterized protein LOC121879676 [Homarus americanus]XP_042242739.1 uncharacterized protein LOC121879676 [Homarus americanus]XP_042242823.1 uncharacterized protein LOC121879676 [Homarus americanus]XP_0